MAFADDLKAAGKTLAAVKHEFRLQHDPHEEKIHAFVEGYDDPFFYRVLLDEHARGRPIAFYNCHGKEKVYGALQDVTQLVGDYKHLLFFVDKDLCNILPRKYPEDNRVYTTDFYSIENYLSTEDVLFYALQSFVVVKRCAIPLDMVIQRYGRESQRFAGFILPLMAWILCVRRAGLRPNLEDVKLKKLFQFTSDLEVVRESNPVALLASMAKVDANVVSVSALKKAIRELRAYPTKKIIRGKFETWFFVEFFKRAVAEIQAAAQAHEGHAAAVVNLEHSNVISLLSKAVSYPPSLKFFMTQHLG